MALIKVAEVGEIPEGAAKKVLVKRQKIAVYHVEGKYYATDDTCTHADASLAEGQIMGCQVACPLHGARFDIKTGEALSMPAVIPVETYRVVIEGSAIMVEV